jgi:hypothetical protein
MVVRLSARDIENARLARKQPAATRLVPDHLFDLAAIHTLEKKLQGIMQRGRPDIDGAQMRGLAKDIARANAEYREKHNREPNTRKLVR